MIAKKCDKCGYIGTCMCKLYRTIDENKVSITYVEFDGILPEPQPTLTEVLNNLENWILSLQRYECNTNSARQDCWASMVEDEEGEYVKLSDVLNLFAPKSK